MQAYAKAMQSRGDFAQYFNDNVTLTVEGTDQRFQGREAVRQGISGTESLGEARLRSLFWGEGRAAAEADFIRKDGHHVPYSVIYDLADGEITALRLYFTGPIQA
jgi:hypothetical protein